MDPAVAILVEQLHQAPWQMAVVLTGGGGQLPGWLLGVPGGSRTLLELAIPYGEAALTRYLGRHPDSFCSAETARDLAGRALDRARLLAPGSPVAGVACTASLRSDRPKRGAHRFHLAFDTGESLTAVSLVLVKEARSRLEEEDVLDRVLLNTLAGVLGLSARVAVSLLPDEVLEQETTRPQDPLSRFLAGDLPAVCVTPDGRCLADAPGPPLLLSGAFNPLHEGHVRMARAGGQQLDREPALELSVVNVAKPVLAPEEVRRRIQQPTWRFPLWLTRAPTFLDKARLFPRVTFLIGFDTAVRLFDPHFYAASEERMYQALDEIRALGCRFLVAGRVDARGVFRTLEDVAIPGSYRDLLESLPATVFREDISSTQLRAGK